MDTARLRWTIVAAALLPFLAGVAGPFVLDDHVNLAPVSQWLAGQRDAWSTVFDNRSGPAGRPLAYLSFMANAAIGGPGPLGFKLVNLGLHAAAALLVFELLRRLLGKLAPGRGVFAAFALALLWAVHPMQVSTVLYVVQRMALLGAIAQLAAVLIYLEGRAALDTDARRARLLLFVAFPLALLLGLGAKETVLVAPLLCLAVETCLIATARPRRETLAFFAVFLVLPTFAALAWALGSGRFDSGYLGREFSLAQRLLAEPGVLLEYAGHWFWPVDLGLYRDGYPPAAGVAGIVVWSALFVAALLTRRRVPLFALGILWFLATHSLEAGPFALELYFEHRNYLASLGLVLAVYGLLPENVARHAPKTLLALTVLLATLTAYRAHQWGDIDRLLASEGPPHGEISRRLQVDRAIRAAQHGDAAARGSALEVLAKGSQSDRAAAAAWSAIFACDADGGLASAQREALIATPPAVLTHNHLSWLTILTRRAADGGCSGLTQDDMRRVLDAWEHGARQPLSRRARWQLPALRAKLDGAQR